ncbi:hypothetical protein FJ942_28060 [Mesorhizobium sp. B2-4-2]|uniref:FGGY-family carbohydrate kinase n=1 Tax=unclassified Mesorhizobium TaxID=325217 RepID=UPI00112A5948|nr:MULTISPECIES: FGGY-family carbohydrate kinase [unclassified Mesorhizobium]MBZ9961899.1 hypothetical protein [Mesorhizobium sp. BR1-1-14]TPL42341.1 hypothetical protein FJ937_28250 [Mesorhizobium sp. B2-4-4]TPL46695.1 hypothetical protein FJ942_28060 [Mesorhizobium sp. B2-4-2]TPM38743.1 hypothetical protein FJ951_27760 [Mesorhizobium sp. B2-2-3]
MDCPQETLTLADPISIDGGLVRSTFFCQFLADILGREIICSQIDELTALGCATLANDQVRKIPMKIAAGVVARFFPAAIARDDLRARHKDAIGRARGWR